MDKQFQQAALQRIRPPQPTQVIAVCSGKGGVGKTSVAVNLAVALGAYGHNVCVLDADVSLANVDVLLGLQPRFNLSHVVRGEVDIESTILQGPQGIRIIPASSGNFEMSRLDAQAQSNLVNAFSGLHDQPDMLIVDTAAGLSPAVAHFVQASETPVVVLRDEPSSLTDAYALIKVFSRHYGIDRFQVITNQSMTQSAGRRLFGKLAGVTDSYLDVVLRHLGDVPDDRYLQKSVQQQRAVVEAFPRSPSAQAFLRLAEAVAALPTQGKPTGGMQFFMEQLVMAQRAYRGNLA